MDLSLEDFLNQLADTDQPIPLDHIQLLSDLDTTQAAVVALRWPSISKSRRSALLDHCGRLAEEDVHYLFEPLNRIALEDPFSAIRIQAIRNLWECEAPDLIPILLARLLHSEQDEERVAAAEALGQFVYLGEFDEIREASLAEMETALFHAVEHDPSPEVRRQTLESLGYSSHPRVAGFISAFYKSEHEQDQIAALSAMGRSADPVWDEIVQAAIQHASPKIRLQAAHAAGELELDSAVDDLIELFDDIDAGIQAAAIWSLGQIGGDAARESLLILEESDDELLVELVQEALEHLDFVEGSDNLSLFDINDTQGP
ncbi:MAG: HEAT repeat domain-containing protein [Anaerolineales bacterium]|nr:HEAT repeat domain-containing protein [Anaerolineales bacterium]